MPPTLQISILILMPLVCPGWLSCCLLSSQQHLHLSTSCCTAASRGAPLPLWCTRLLSTLAFCCVTSCHATTVRLCLHLSLHHCLSKPSVRTVEMLAKKLAESPALHGSLRFLTSLPPNNSPISSLIIPPLQARHESVEERKI